ncbi:hypothetical protein [Gallibacterium anatis]|uniref:hypothetical protein n=1 Tax=Gallibacterium anatis TaxID=750 RepID=UPI00266F1890|nr:hypothetical protein [Gallibacterium anatis]WKS98300.1 hypothetical protein NYR19_05915 [Gallibacterium anatis]
MLKRLIPLCIIASFSSFAVSDGKAKSFKASDFEINTYCYLVFYSQDNKGNLSKCGFLPSALKDDSVAKKLDYSDKKTLLMAIGLNEFGLNRYCNNHINTKCVDDFARKMKDDSERFIERTGIPYTNVLKKSQKLRLLELDDFLGTDYYRKSFDMSLSDDYISDIKEYGEGQYRVGIDIPEGEYQLFAKSYLENEPGFYKIENSAAKDINSLVSSNIFTRNIFIKVEKGQYLTITDAYAIKVLK